MGFLNSQHGHINMTAKTIGKHGACELFAETPDGKMVRHLLVPETRARSALIKPLYEGGRLIGYVGIRNRSFVYRAVNCKVWTALSDHEVLEAMQLVAETNPHAAARRVGRGRGRAKKVIKKAAKRRAPRV